MKPLLFISHSSEDKKIVEIVLRLLDKHVRIQPDQVRYSSRHDYGLQPGDHISIKIRADIQKSISMLALITDNSLNSEYVASELGGAWALNKRVILIYGPNLSRPKLGPPLSEYKHFSWNDTNEWLNLIKLLNKEISGTDFKENIDRDIEEAIKAIRETQPSRVSVIWKMINKKPLPFIILSLFLLPVVTYLGYQNYFVLSKEPISIDMECGRVTSDSVGVDSFDDCFASIKEWQKEFNRRNNPKVNINVRPMEEIAPEADRYRDRYQRIRNNIDKKKNRYDIIQVDVIWTKIFGADFGDLEMPTEDQKQHFPAMIEAGTFTTLESGKSIKKLKAVPWSADIGVLYYNKRIVDDLSKGLDMGSGPPQTWDDLTRVATKAYENSDIGFIQQNGESDSESFTCAALEWISIFGGGIFDRPDHVNFANESVVNAITKAALLMYQISQVSPKNRLLLLSHGFNTDKLSRLGDENSANEFKNGKVAFMRHWLARFLSLNLPDNEYRVSPLPKDGQTGKRVGALGGLMLVDIYKGPSQEKAAAVKKVIVDLASKRAQKIRMDFGILPTIPDLFGEIPNIIDKGSTSARALVNIGQSIDEIVEILRSGPDNNERSLVIRPADITHHYYEKVSSKFRVAIREIFDLKDLPTQQDKVNEGILKEQVKRILTDLQTELEREKVLP